MPVFDNYSIQYTEEKRKNVSFLPYVSAVLRVISLAAIIPTVTVSLYFLAVVFAPAIVSFVVDAIYKRNAYTVVVTCRENAIEVNKVLFDDKTVGLYEIPYKIITKTEWVEKGNDGMIRLMYGESCVELRSDAYLYAVVETRRAS